jgi:acetyl-CoA carboxylase biotin carboxyl carrier protein
VGGRTEESKSPIEPEAASPADAAGAPEIPEGPVADPRAPGSTGAAPDIVPVMAAPRDGGDVELLGLIDRLASLLDRSDLTELEVEAGGTGLVLRKPAALVPQAAATGPATTATSASTDSGASGAGRPTGQGADASAPQRPSVKAPLTGIFYASPAPGSAPYVSAGGDVAVGQVIGLIEAMKLFNEIKSDLAGRVVRVVAESGTLVKARQPLIEVDPL